MIVKILKSVAFLVLIGILGFYIDFVVLYLLEKILLFICDIPWSSPWLFSCFIIFIGFPVILIILAMALIPIGLLRTIILESGFNVSLFEALFCTIYSIIKLISNFKTIFLIPHINIINNIGQGFLYYTGAIVTFCIILYVYLQIMGAIAVAYNHRDLY